MHFFDNPPPMHDVRPPCDPRTNFLDGLSAHWFDLQFLPEATCVPVPVALVREEARAPPPKESDVLTPCTERIPPPPEDDVLEVSLADMLARVQTSAPRVVFNSTAEKQTRARTGAGVWCETFFADGVPRERILIG